MQQTTDLPQTIRVSLGTAIVLGLLEGKLDAMPTTAYLMTYKTGKCTANCGFCPQAQTSKSSTELLSRISWPTFPTQKVITALATASEEGTIRRVCIQALNFREVFGHLYEIVKGIKECSPVPISVSCQPKTRENMERLALAGVNRLGIALDAATEEVFSKVKGVGTGAEYHWGDQFRQLKEALTVFGRGNVSTHVIVGLGESEQDVVKIIQRIVDLGVLPALFSFTPVRGTTLEARSPPKLEAYRRIQLARFLVVTGKVRVENMQFDNEGNIVDFGLTNEELDPIIDNGLPFRTSGCPDCNRPYYNEKPSGPIYNYPKQPDKVEIEKIKKQLA